MDLNLWNDIEPSGRVRPYEFSRPEHMAERQVVGLGITRIETGRVMRFTKDRAGRIYHPNGDAVPPNSKSHASRSLHKYGLKGTAAGALANDFDFATDDPNHLFELYLRILRVRFPFPPYRWTGIGVYADWTLDWKPNPGFHVDQRPEDHDTMRGRGQIQTWLRVEGKYQYPLTWAAYRAAFGLAVIG